MVLVRQQNRVKGLTGPARDVPCYPGRDDDQARYTATYLGAEPIDMYASEHLV